MGYKHSLQGLNIDNFIPNRIQRFSLILRQISVHYHTEAGKQFAVKDFVEHVIEITRASGLTNPISVGFSDDDEGNVIAVESYVRDALSHEFPGIKFVVYYTADPDTPSGRKVIVRGQLDLDL